MREKKRVRERVRESESTSARERASEREREQERERERERVNLFVFDTRTHEQMLCEACKTLHSRSFRETGLSIVSSNLMRQDEHRDNRGLKLSS